MSRNYTKMGMLFPNYSRERKPERQTVRLLKDGLSNLLAVKIRRYAFTLSTFRIGGVYSWLKL